MGKDFINSKVIAVVVSYNRRELLEQTLNGINNGEVIPKGIVLVDNASTDDTQAFLAQYDSKVPLKLISLSKNMGGAGGFTIGMAEAMKLDPQLLWLMDDDTVPEKQTLKELVRVWFEYSPISAGRPAFVASKVVWNDGREHPMNTPRQRPSVAPSAIEAAKAVSAIQVRSASFVSLLVDAKDVKRVGLPIADYFLWNDDFEYSTRLAKHAVGLFAPTSEVLHLTKEFGSTDKDPGVRFVWEVRNKLWMFKHSNSLSPAEKVLYGGASALRWGKTIAKSKDPLQLVKHFGTGLKDGFTKSPKSNETVLAETYELKPILTGKTKEKIPAKFSVLLPVYKNDLPEFFARAYQSITEDQTLKPDEIVIVQDGPVGAELTKMIEAFATAAKVPFIHHILEENSGLATALDVGLARCSYEIVARMDADDISLPERFEKQLKIILDGADIVGSSLLEFNGSEDHIVAERIVKDDPKEIIKQARFSCPFNHPTVMYRKSKVVAAGGYRKLNLLEDYWLWARLIEAGAKVANVVEPLLLYRVSAGAYKRRGGAEVFISEIKLQNNFLSEGFVSPIQWVRNIAIRGGYRFIPENVRKQLYRKILAKEK
ncbi:MAG: glycosyltransferase [Micrococcaceae bacterium]